MENPAPGFRFCPTDEEILICYLRPKALGKPFPLRIIAEVDIYKYEPWDLPDLSVQSTKDPEWYFFGTQDKKYSHTARINRTTSKGFWKATGKDRKVYSGQRLVGLKKSLIYYKGRAPQGCRTDWIMHEYRLDQESEKKEKGMLVSVLCRIRKKGGPGPRNGEQYGAIVWNENGVVDDDNDGVELKPRIATTPFNDPGDLDEDIVEGVGNAFNLQNQLKHLIPQSRPSGQMELMQTDTHESPFKRISKASTWRMDTHSANTLSAGKGVSMGKMHPIGDSQLNFDVPFSDVCFHEGDDPFDGYQWNDVGDCPALFNDGQCFISSVSGTGSPQFAGSDLSGYGISVDALSENGSTLRDIAQYPPSFQAPATQRVDMLAPASIWSDGRIMDEVAESWEQYTGSGRLQLQVEKHSLGAFEDIMTPINGNSKSKANGSQHCSSMDSRIMPPTVESSTQSYLSKHISTYSVSKCEVVPPEVFYASLTQFHDPCMERNKKLVSAVLSREDEQLLHFENLKISQEELLTSVSDTQHDAEQLCNKADYPKACLIGDKILTEVQKTVCLSDLSVPTLKPTECGVVRENEYEGEVLLASIPCQTCHKRETFRRRKVIVSENVNVPAILNSARKHRVRRWLKNKLKQNALGVKFIHLEEEMRSKVNDRFSSYTKPAVGLSECEDNTDVNVRFSSYTKPAVGLSECEDSTDAFHRSKYGIVLILCHLVSEILVLSCLEWGYHVALLYAASSVSVQ